jgi:F-type H+-transporting ATPase subunit b
LIILFVLARYVIPPINKAMTERQQRIQQQFAESEEAKARAEAAEQEYKDALTGARQEASRTREEAREQGASIIAEMRTQAQAESSRILTAARAQLEAERQQVMNHLAARDRDAGHVVGEPRRGGVAGGRGAPAPRRRAFPPRSRGAKRCRGRAGT